MVDSIDLDPEGRVRSWSPGIEALVGVPRHVALGRRIDELSDGAEGFGWSDVLARLPQAGRWQCVARWGGREASCPWLSVGAEVLPAEGTGRSAGWRVWLRAFEGPEAPVERTPGAGAGVEPWAARAVAHDLGSIFMAIECFAGLLAPALPGDGPAREVLGHLVGATRRGSELSREALASGRDDGETLYPVAPDGVAEDLLPILRALLRPGVALHADIEEGLPTVLSSHRHLEAVLMNLVANARDAIEGTGRIDVRVARVGEGSASEVRLSVTDTGSGVSPGSFERMLEPYFTTKPRERGSGLGLAVVVEAVRVAGGRLEVTSMEHQGTTVALSFDPFGLRSAVPTRSRWAERSSRPGRPSLLLAVVPESRVARPLEVLLKRSGFDVQVRQHANPLRHRGWDRAFDVVLLELPPMEALADECPMTGADSPPTIYLRPASAGAWACGGTVLDLPCDPRDILRSIDRLVSWSDQEYAFGLH